MEDRNYRDAGTGRFVTEEDATARLAETVSEKRIEGLKVSFCSVIFAAQLLGRTPDQVREIAEMGDDMGKAYSAPDGVLSEEGYETIVLEPFLANILKGSSHDAEDFERERFELWMRYDPHC